MSFAKQRLRVVLRAVAPRLRAFLGIQRAVDVRFVPLGGPAQVTDEGVIEFDPDVCATLPWSVLIGVVVEEVLHVLRGDQLLRGRDERRRVKCEADHLVGHVLTLARLPLHEMEAFLRTWCPVGDDDEHVPAPDRIAMLRGGSARARTTLAAHGSRSENAHGLRTGGSPQRT